MKKKDLSKKENGELEKDMLKLKEDNRNFRFGISGSKVKNVKEAMGKRKDIARIMTELNKRKKHGK